jgi:hypothetical protein
VQRPLSAEDLIDLVNIREKSGSPQTRCLDDVDVRSPLWKNGRMRCHMSPHLRPKMRRLKWILTRKLTGFYAELSDVYDTVDNVDQQYLLPRTWIQLRLLLHPMAAVGG